MPRILLVEDDEECRSTVKELLETHGFEVSEAAHGRAALEWMMSSEAPSLIVLDLEMPVMSGSELLNVLSNDHKLGRVPVLILSGHAKATLLERPAVVGIISKPFIASTFIETVNAHARKTLETSRPS